MIASVRGRVAHLALDAAVIEVGGVGLEVQCTPATLSGLRIGDQAQLATALVVREDALTLFGFADADERAMFALLQTASGVGPRLAQAALAVFTPSTLRQAIATEDVTTLTRVPGIGKKGAQRIVLELKDKLATTSAPPATGAVPLATSGAPGWSTQVRDALVGLGYSAKEADDAVGRAAADLPDAAIQGDEAPDVAEILRVTLRTLSRA